MRTMNRMVMVLFLLTVSSVGWAGQDAEVVHLTGQRPREASGLKGLLIGNYEIDKSDRSQQFNGLMDEVMVWNRALSANEVRRLHDAQNIESGYRQAHLDNGLYNRNQFLDTIGQPFVIRQYPSKPLPLLACSVVTTVTKVAPDFPL
jgi:hypothetical protein